MAGRSARLGHQARSSLRVCRSGRGAMRGSIYPPFPGPGWFATKPLSQIQRSTLWLLRGAVSPRIRPCGFGLRSVGQMVLSPGQWSGARGPDPEQPAKPGLCRSPGVELRRINAAPKVPRVVNAPVPTPMTGTVDAALVLYHQHLSPVRHHPGALPCGGGARVQPNSSGHHLHFLPVCKGCI